MDNLISSYDATTDVLYIKLRNSVIQTSQEAPNDEGLILNRDWQGVVVGVQLLEASEARWSDHPDKGLVPKPIAQAIEAALTHYGLASKSMREVYVFSTILVGIAVSSVLIGTYLSIRVGELFLTTATSGSLLGALGYTIRRFILYRRSTQR